MTAVDTEKTPSRRAMNRTAAAALELKVQGHSWEEIAEIIGYASADRAKLSVEQALERRVKEDPATKEMARAMIEIRLEKLLRFVWSKAEDPEHPEQLAAVGKAREIIADLRKLLGTDAPMEIAVHDPTDQEIKAWVMEHQALALPKVVEADMFAGGAEDDDIVDAEIVETKPPEPLDF